VIVEAAAGDPDAADRRGQFIRDIALLSITDEAVVLAQKLVEAARLPTRAAADALHIYVAAVHGIDYLLTWNSTHIANAEFRPKVEQACRNSGFEPPVLCTPDELMGS
jgi:predicted nucleic acid-binding protein